MVRIKKYTSIGLGFLTVSTAISTTAVSPKSTSNNQDSLANEEINLAVPPLLQIATDTTKRQPQKIYHRFEDIPEIPDNEAFLYDKSEYTYIINADEYQKNGKIILKRVLTGEITNVNTLSLIYRSECATHIPQVNEDQLTQYDIDFKLINETGAYKGPTQMNDVAICSFIKYLAINPQTRQNVLPLLKYSKPRRKDEPQTLDSALSKLEKICYDDSLKLRPFENRKNILTDKAFQNIQIVPNAWQTIASPELKKYIAKEAARRQTGLSQTTKNFLCLTELIPDKTELTQELETYNLSTFPIGRVAPPKQILMELALSMNLKNNENNLDVTRIPLVVIAAAISHVNWQGNGKQALKEARDLKKIYQNNPDKFKQTLILTAKRWVTGKSRRYGVDELKQMNMITPTLITQYQMMELPGAETLAHEYAQAVAQEEAKAFEASPHIAMLPFELWQKKKSMDRY